MKGGKAGLGEASHELKRPPKNKKQKEPLYVTYDKRKQSKR